MCGITPMWNLKKNAWQTDSWGGEWKMGVNEEGGNHIKEGLLKKIKIKEQYCAACI